MLSLLAKLRVTFHDCKRTGTKTVSSAPTLLFLALSASSTFTPQCLCDNLLCSMTHHLDMRSWWSANSILDEGKKASIMQHFNRCTGTLGQDQSLSNSTTCEASNSRAPDIDSRLGRITSHANWTSKMFCPNTVLNDNLFVGFVHSRDCFIELWFRVHFLSKSNQLKARQSKHTTGIIWETDMGQLKYSAFISRILIRTWPPTCICPYRNSPWAPVFSIVKTDVTPFLFFVSRIYGTRPIFIIITSQVPILTPWRWPISPNLTP